jgi:hypothetical protein
VPSLTLEEVGKGLPGREFADLAIALSACHPGADWLLAGQRRRLLAHRPPGGQAALLLARRDGRPVARLSAHRQVDGEGCFGFFAVEGPRDLAAVEALLAAAASWLVEHGSPSVIGPLSWTAAEEAGVMVEGNDQPAVTGRAWTPAWYGDLLEAAGLEVAEEQCSYRLSAGGDGPALVRAELVAPPDVGRFADGALMLVDPGSGGSVVAVPDLAGGLGAAGPGHGAWSMARQARRREWTGCVVTSVDGPPETMIPGLCAAAGRAGYQWVLSPWAPDDRAPVMRHRLYRSVVASVAQA